MPESVPWVSWDETVLIFSRELSSTDSDMFISVGSAGVWGAPTPMPFTSLNGPGREAFAWPITDGLNTILITTDLGGSFDIYQATRPNPATQFVLDPAPLPFCGSGTDETGARLSDDRLQMIYFGGPPAIHRVLETTSTPADA